MHAFTEVVVVQSILVPRGRAPFGQHQESRPLARSNDILADILSLFSCNRGMRLLKNETRLANYCTFKMKETNV